MKNGDETRDPHCGIAVVLCACAALTLGANVSALADSFSPTNIVVAPLTDAHWTQGAPYNGYSPLKDNGENWAAGCVAIAASQELLVWQWPWRFGATHEVSHIVSGSDNSVIRFDGTVPFDWASLKNSYSSSDSFASRHAAARLTLFCQSLVQMQFVSSGGEAKKGIDGTMEWYEYDGNVTPSSGDAALAKILADLEFGSPLQVGVNVGGYGGHEVVGVGYGTGTNATGETVQLLGLNMGWGGAVQWWNLASTSGSYIKSAKVGFRPIKSVQIEPLAPVSGSSVTLNWHLPNCYTNKISGFTVAKKTLSASTTTWTDDFAAGGKGRSSNANAMRAKDGALFAWDGTTSSIYTYDEKFELTSDSVLTYDVGSAYMSGMQARFEAKFGDGEWQKIGDIHLNGGRTSYYDKDGAPSTMTSGVAINLGAYGGKIAQFRIAVEYTSGGTYANNWASMKIDNLSVSNVRMFEADTVVTINDASVRTATQSGLETNKTYAISVAPIMSDGSASVTQTVTTVVGTPAAAPSAIELSAIINGIEMIQEGFYLECGSGTTTFNVTSVNATALQALPSHLSILPDNAVSVSGNGGVFTVTIDGSKLSSRWEGAKTILTLKASNGDGAVAAKDIVLKFNRNVVMGARTYTLTGSTNATAAVEFIGGTTINGDGHTLTVKAGAFTGSGDVTLTNGTFVFEDLGDFEGTINVDSSAAVSFAGASCPALKGSGAIAISADATIDDYSQWNGTLVVASGATVTVPSQGLGWTDVENGGTLKVVLTDEEVAYGYSTSKAALNSGTLLFVNASGQTLMYWTSDAAPFAYDGTCNVWQELSGGGQNNSYNTAARWTKGVPVAGDYVVLSNFNGSTIYLDSPGNVTLEEVRVKGYGTQMLLKDHPMATYGYATYYTIRAKIFKNEVPVDIGSTLFQPEILEPLAMIYLKSGGLLSGSVVYDYISNMRTSDLQDSTRWRGTVVITGTDNHITVDNLGNSLSFIRMNGNTGSLYWGDVSHVPIELVDPDGGIAFDWNNGYGDKTNFVGKIFGNGTLKVRGTTTSVSEKVVIRDMEEFFGNLELSAKTLVLGTSVPTTTSSDGRLHLCSGYGATVAAGKTWKIGGGVYLDGSQTLDVKGVLDTTHIFANAANPLLMLSDGGLIEVDTIPSASQRINVNLYAGTFRIDGDATVSDGFCFSSTNGTYTTLDVNGHELTFGSNAISGHGAIYPTSSAENSKGRVVFQNMGYFAGDIIIDGTTVVELPEEMSDFEGRILLAGSEMATSAGREGDVVLNDGAVLTLSLSNEQVRSGYTTSKVALDGSSALVFADEDGNVLSVLSSADAVNGTFSIAAQEPVYAGPAPTAVWLTGEFEDAASKHNGYSIVRPDSGISVTDGKLVVAGNATTGATIDLTSTNANKVTVLIEYSSLAAVSGKNVTLATVKDSESHVIGARTTANGALTLTGYFDANSDNNYAFDTVPTMTSGTGYLMLMYDDTTDNSVNGTYCYAGSTIATLAGGRNDTLKWTGNSRKINEASIGGPITSTRVAAWPGVKIEKVALFVGEALTNKDIANYKFPEPTVVARFVNGGDSTDYISLDEAMMALAVVLHSNPNSGAYVEVVDDGLEAPNEYGSSGIGYSATERKYARAVAKLDNGTATYPAFLNLADAWAAAGKGADTATITIIAAPSDSVTIEVGQTLKVDGLALADDKVLVGENRIKHATTENGVTTYTAKYTDAVTLLDGTIYHGNDANRAVITNYLSQMVGHRPVKMPAPSTVDLLLVYDPNAVAYATNHYSTIEEHAAHNVAVMNQALTATDIDTNVWFRIAGIYQVDVAAAHVDDALSKLNSGTAEGWDQVNAMRDQVGADIVLGVVYTNSNYGLANWCSPTAIMNGSAANSAFAGVRADAAWAWVHEVGHTASLFHNPVEAAGTYHDTTSIGCGFVKTAAADAAELRSLMDSGTAQMAFSSPNHMSHGEVYSVTNASGAWVDSSGELARLLPYMAKYRTAAQDQVAKIADTYYSSLAEAVAVATASQAESVEISLLLASTNNVTLDSKTTVTEASAGLYTGTLSGSGTLVLAGTRSSALSFDAWTGTVEVPQITSGKVELKFYGVEGSTVRLGGGMTGGWIANETVYPTIEIPPGKTLLLSAFSPSFANTFKKLKGAGTFAILVTPNEGNDLANVENWGADKNYSAYFLMNNAADFTGTFFVNEYVGIAIGTSKPGKNTVGGKILVYTSVVASANWSAPNGIVLADAAATLTVENGVTVPTVSTSLSGYGVVRNGNVYSVERVTGTDYPVPYSWFSIYDPDISVNEVEQRATNIGANGLLWWECYVLGLDPTNALSKFTATIRMDGVTPVVEYSPTNETLVAAGKIEYVLQGKPTLTNDWSDCPSFDEPGDTNRFFRVKVTWQE